MTKKVTKVLFSSALSKAFALSDALVYLSERTENRLWNLLITDKRIVVKAICGENVHQASMDALLEEISETKTHKELHFLFSKVFMDYIESHHGPVDDWNVFHEECERKMDSMLQQVVDHLKDLEEEALRSGHTATSRKKVVNKHIADSNRFRHVLKIFKEAFENEE